jgi:hypothetical protein
MLFVCRSAIALALFSTSLLACGGDDSSNNGTPDAKVYMDAKVFMDAPPYMGLGQACTPDAMNPQGNCPAGFVCLALMNQPHAWCSKSCASAQDTSCATGYTGPGAPICGLNVQDQMGNMARFCLIVCQDTSMTCPSTTCNGSCPGELACTLPLQNAQMQQVATGCI